MLSSDEAHRVGLRQDYFNYQNSIVGSILPRYQAYPSTSRLSKILYALLRLILSSAVSTYSGSYDGGLLGALLLPVRLHVAMPYAVYYNQKNILVVLISFKETLSTILLALRGGVVSFKELEPF